MLLLSKKAIIRSFMVKVLSIILCRLKFYPYLCSVF
nr:MAG TPA: hypothetical protein [Caudoviricetes sp.]